jgi:hypothetical protein
VSVNCILAKANPSKQKHMRGKITYANNTLASNQLDQLILDAPLRSSLSIGLEVAQVTDMALLVLWCAVRLVVRVEMGSRARAAVGVVTESVHVHAALGVGVVARNVVGYGGGRRLGGLLEGYGALDAGVSAEDGDCAIILLAEWFEIEGTA